jgi:hypothetical protein
LKEPKKQKHSQDISKYLQKFLKLRRKPYEVKNGLFYWNQPQKRQAKVWKTFFRAKKARNANRNLINRYLCMKNRFRNVDYSENGKRIATGCQNIFLFK